MWANSKRIIMEVIEVDQLEDTNNGKLSWAMSHSGLKPKLKDTNNKRLSWAMPHSGIKPKIENDQIRNLPQRGRRPSMEDDLRWKTTFDGRRPSMKDNLRWKTIFDRRRASMEDDLWYQHRHRLGRGIIDEVCIRIASYVVILAGIYSYIVSDTSWHNLDTFIVPLLCRSQL